MHVLLSRVLLPVLHTLVLACHLIVLDAWMMSKLCQQPCWHACNAQGIFNLFDQVVTQGLPCPLMDGVQVSHDICRTLERVTLTNRKVSRLSLISGVILSLSIKPKSLVMMLLTRVLIMQRFQVTIFHPALDLAMFTGGLCCTCCQQLSHNDVDRTKHL